jgi:hypothetical protein
MLGKKMHNVIFFINGFTPTEAELKEAYKLGDPKNVAFRNAMFVTETSPIEHALIYGGSIPDRYKKHISDNFHQVDEPIETKSETKTKKSPKWKPNE